LERKKRGVPSDWQRAHGRKREVMKNIFRDHVVRKRGDERNLSGHMVRKGDAKKVLAIPTCFPKTSPLNSF
jgi:hypothetical protein